MPPSVRAMSSSISCCETRGHSSECDASVLVVDVVVVVMVVDDARSVLSLLLPLSLERLLTCRRTRRLAAAAVGSCVLAMAILVAAASGGRASAVDDDADRRSSRSSELLEALFMVGTAHQIDAAGQGLWEAKGAAADLRGAPGGFLLALAATPFFPAMLRSARSRF